MEKHSNTSNESGQDLKKPSNSPQPHRCAKHVEDLMVAIMHFKVQDQFGLVWRCMRSEKGQEPPRHSPNVKPDHNV
ncbi:hypothetical protein BX616_005284 [Lobosporangium transversale]|uniref:Uncharacterized protein n=1 Tax=Lobosporangium transversale TaxID=64571 RepID=A0A1Y2H100_9FUNG|nr:hypothetical protein BCR41DRAFT_344871 [Lobosporangium transversale]KAF9897607.1 hypothetical protein BX616_005284 [Lobosporangium transversale]ORZ28228.1 hypothetical protein BCR41DRAFT_344871 [Lobosporangium transversale]|eukprot:XP_021885913.1 hypothetical protein BCR41DRAFT_344871 [Lobosporangium transversale]